MPLLYAHSTVARKQQKSVKLFAQINYLIKGNLCKADTWYYNILEPSNFSIMHLINERSHIDTAEIELKEKKRITE